jgi:hypothetical protein
MLDLKIFSFNDQMIKQNILCLEAEKATNKYVRILIHLLLLLEGARQTNLCGLIWIEFWTSKL